MAYAIKKTVDYSYEEAIERVTEELKKEGFGVLSEVDVKKTLKEKIDVDRDKYVILGACNPHYAHQAMEMEPDLGLLLPCNVVVYEHEGKTVVAAMDPESVLGLVGNEQMNEVASQVKAKLASVIESV